MRLDKFLKVSGLVRRRTVAREVADRGRVLVNGRVAKPATTLRVGDLIVLALGRRQLEVEVLSLRPVAPDPRTLYRVVREIRADPQHTGLQLG
ncbi:MAG: RNA-binding S4 domain-containing protein [bacterium]|nr:RNA-binding S4 domain-containing protein [bacterium]